ncbi:MAG TPA: hypothetical protein PKD00_08780 [Burkholderiales bacterium]|nr:hypothetical protein [Burkholderiales bacterium]
MNRLDLYIKRYFERYTLNQFFLNSIYNVISEQLSYKNLLSCCENDSCNTVNYKQTLPQLMNKYLVPKVFYKHIQIMLENLFKCGGKDCCGNTV